MDVNDRVDALLGEAVRPGALDAEAQRRAVAAFRSARDEGGHRARTRRRDDWRPRMRRRTLGSLRAAVGAAVAGVLLGGVAIASIGTSRTPDDGPPASDRPSPPHSTPAAQRPTPPLPRPSPSPSPETKPLQSETPGKAKAEGKAKAKGKTKAKNKGKNKAKPPEKNKAKPRKAS